MTVYGVSGSYAEKWAGSVGAAFVKNDVPATQVVLDKSQITMNKGKSTTLTITVTPSDFTDEVDWRSSDTLVVTVKEGGILSAVGAGTATVKVTAGNVSASCQVTVVQPVTSISLNRTSLTLSLLETFRLTASVYPADAQNKKIKWTSSAPEVAQVDEDGLITAVSGGTTEITAQAEDGSGVKRSCTVTISGNMYYVNAVDKLESPHDYENNCNDIWSYTLPGKKKLEVVFDSRTKVEEKYDYLYLYDGKGNLIGEYTGTELAGKTIAVEGDTIRIKLQSDRFSTEWGFKVTSVREMPDPGIRLTASGATIQAGGSTIIKIASIYPEDDTVTYQSSNTAVAAVDSAGKVTAKAVER
ncbi:MAG: Ig-like domain-containing protein [Roseburia sp.]|nr:Ig-like domain-containing protein [Roseburia sp.]